MLDLLENNAQGQSWKQKTFAQPVADAQTLTWVRTDGSTAVTEGSNLTFETAEFTAEVKRRLDAYAAAQAYKDAHPNVSTGGF
jgi:hypothetical protein